MGQRLVSPRPQAHKISLLILAGGRATRLGGVRKASLEVGGRSILERIVAALGPLADEHLVLVDDDQPLGTPDGLRQLVDPQPHAGVLPALLHGLSAATGDICLIVASDMPFVSRAAFEYLLARQEQEQVDVVVPRVDGILQPMHAVVRRQATLDALRTALVSGEQRLFRVLASMQCREVDADELRRVDPDLRTLFNVNTAADLASAQVITTDTIDAE